MNEQGGAWAPHDYPPSTTHQANRRRLYVFLGTLAAALVIGLGFIWLRPAEYRASAHLEIYPATGSAPGEPAGSPAPEVRPFLTEVQILTSRPVLELAAKRLERAGQRPAEGASDPVADRQPHLEAIALSNTNIVELVATGPRPEVLAPFVTAIIDAYREHLAEAFRDSSAESMAQGEEEVKKLKDDVTSKRREVEAFRTRHNIPSVEQEQNHTLAQTRSLSASLANANESVAKVEEKLRALTDAAAAGKTVAPLRDDPTLASLEQRASTLREQLRDLERDFTPGFIAKNPNVAVVRQRIVEVERQIAAQRDAGQRNTLAQAREELTSAQSAAMRIQNQIAKGQKDLGQFTARLNEYKAQQDQLNAVETAYQDASRRLAKLDATVRARTTTLKLLDPPSTPQQPWRPNYWRDTAVCLGASLVLALLAMGLVELFNRSEPRPGVVVLQAQSGGLPSATAQHTLGWQEASAIPLAARAPALLQQAPTFPRELSPDEVASLVQGSDDDSRLAVLLLLSGVSPDEALALRWSDVDLAGNRIHVGGGAARDVALHDSLRAPFAARAAAARSEFVLGQQDRPASRDTVNAQLLCGAHDAGIENAIDVTPDCLRHTYVAFLVRQGIRFADLTRLVGQLPAEVLGAYSTLSPTGSRVPQEAINVVFPAFRSRESA
ncbi:MAG: tyrosine-type recombinase/integrase [Burkholderiales bacterium]